MAIPSFEPSMILAILPEILLFVLAGLVLAIDLLWRPKEPTGLAWITAGGLAAVLLATLAFARPGAEETLVLGGMLRHDWPAFAFKLIFIFAAAITALLSAEVRDVGRSGEYFALLLVTTMGMSLMASAADLIMLFLAIETTSIPLYILAGFLKNDVKSTEAGMKYFLFGALTSAVMLYGFSLLYGFSGQTNLYALAEGLRVGQLSPWVLAGAVVLVLVGFGFKVSVVPFHFWSPDVYEGAPTPITAYVSTASKAAGFAVLVRVMLAVFPAAADYWVTILAVLSAATMTLGNVIALAQSNIKRLLAYSSIAHAGYALMGLVALSQLGAASVVFYVGTYVATNLAAFGVVVLFANAVGSDEIASYAALSRRNAPLALAFMVAILSLAGMPPLVGFVAKFYVFAAAVESNLIWLAFVGVLNSIVGLYYYLTVLKVVYLYRSEDEDKPVPVSRPYATALTLCVVAIVVIGIASGPWLDWSLNLAKSLF